MIEKTLTLAIPCRADEPGLGSTLDSLLAACRSPALPSACLREILICLNGVAAGRPSPPLHAVREFCTRHAVSLDEIDLASAQERAPQAEAGLRCVVLVAAWRGKLRAMNALWRWARGDLLAFCDADVLRMTPYHGGSFLGIIPNGYWLTLLCKALILLGENPQIAPVPLNALTASPRREALLRGSVNWLVGGEKN